MSNWVNGVRETKSGIEDDESSIHLGHAAWGLLSVARIERRMMTLKTTTDVINVQISITDKRADGIPRLVHEIGEADLPQLISFLQKVVDDSQSGRANHKSLTTANNE